jgi:cytochrome c peroxidase
MLHVAKHCAAPSGMVLSEDEAVLWVYCGATNDLAEVRLLPAHSDVSAADRQPPTLAPIPTQPPPSTVGVSARLLLVEDPLGPGGATGRKLFYNATDFATSGGLGCAGCHPEGRDDGHVWHEASFTNEDGDTVNFVGSVHNIPKEAHTKGYARRTPMLAGRVNAAGPYGWHAESPTIEERETKGFSLHRWGAVPETPKPEQDKRARALFDYLRRGLVPPPRLDGALSAQEARGQELFLSKDVGCVECHDPKTGYTTRKAYPLPLRPLASGFDEDPDARYKIPGLQFLAGRAPYFHDGSAASLEELVESNGTRMGNTASLSADDRAALVAFLKTL